MDIFSPKVNSVLDVTGSVILTGSLTATGNLQAEQISGSFIGDGSGLTNVVPLVATPSNVSPADEAVDISETPTLVGSTYLSLYGDTMAAANWQVSEDADFATTVVDDEEAGTSVEFTVDAGILDEDTVYYWRVRYKDSDNNFSAFSTATEFTTEIYPVLYIAVAHFTSPFVSAYPFDATAGFGTKFTNPSTLPTGNGFGVAFSPAGDAIAIAHGTSPFVSAYPWSGSGFGTKYSNPATLPTGAGAGVAFTPAGDAIAIAHSSSPHVSAYPWSGSGFGTKYANPATLPASTGKGVTFSPAGDAIAVTHTGTPSVSAYPWSGSGFGTKYSNPSPLPNPTDPDVFSCYSVAFSPDGNAIAVTADSSPYVLAYAWSGSGFGTKFTNPATLPANQGEGVAFTPAGDAIAVGHVSSPFITAYPWSGSGFGTKYANPSVLGSGTFGRGVAFTPAGDALALALDNSPRIIVYPWSGSGFGTKYNNPATLPTGDGRAVAFTLA